MRNIFKYSMIGLALLSTALFLLIGWLWWLRMGLTLEPLSTYESGLYFADAAEIVAHDPQTQRLFVVNGSRNTVDVLDLNDPTDLRKITEIDIATFGRPTSVAVHGSLLAVAAANENRQAPGSVIFFQTDGAYLGAVDVGPLPDMLTFTPDGRTLLVANEGEPNESYGVDPEGSISLIDLTAEPEQIGPEQVTNLGFAAFEGQADIDVFGPKATLAQDVEPEYIAVSPDGKRAWVSLQENNALAEVDLETQAVTRLMPLGYKDHNLPQNGLDASDRDEGITIQPWPVRGLYRPDAVAAYAVNGQTYLLSANEGDRRNYEGYTEVSRIKNLVLDAEQFPDAKMLQQDENLGRLRVTTSLGDTDGDGQFEALYTFGGRSFSIWDTSGGLIFDSSNQMARIIAALYPQGFNANTDDDSFDTRSDDQGVEPEGLALGAIDGRTYAFIGLERVGGIMIYDVSDPFSPAFVNYNTTRNFEGHYADGSAGDIAPEGLRFIPAEQSPTREPLLVVGYEASGTTTVFAVSNNPRPDIPGFRAYGRWLTATYIAFGLCLGLLIVLYIIWRRKSAS